MINGSQLEAIYDFTKPIRQKIQTAMGWTAYRGWCQVGIGYVLDAGGDNSKSLLGYLQQAEGEGLQTMVTITLCQGLTYDQGMVGIGQGESWANKLMDRLKPVKAAIGFSTGNEYNFTKYTPLGFAKTHDLFCVPLAKVLRERGHFLWSPAWNNTPNVAGFQAYVKQFADVSDGWDIHTYENAPPGGDFAKAYHRLIIPYMQGKPWMESEFGNQGPSDNTARAADLLAMFKDKAQAGAKALFLYPARYVPSQTADGAMCGVADAAGDEHAPYWATMAAAAQWLAAPAPVPLPTPTPAAPVPTPPKPVLTAGQALFVAEQVATRTVLTLVQLPAPVRGFVQMETQGVSSPITYDSFINDGRTVFAAHFVSAGPRAVYCDENGKLLGKNP